MRQLFIGIVVMVICGKGFSQVHEQVYDNMPMYTIIGDSIYRDSGQNLNAYPRGRFIENTVPSPPADTIPCIMLVSVMFLRTEWGEPLMPVPSIMKGYYIIQNFSSMNWNDNDEYLDENKNPLSKNIIVWMTKQTN